MKFSVAPLVNSGENSDSVESEASDSLIGRSDNIDIKDGWEWWIGELGEVAGSLWRRLGFAHHRYREVALRATGGDILDVECRPGTGEKRIHVRACASTHELADAIPRGSRRPLVLSLSAEDCFIRRLWVPQSALFNLDKILDLEINRATPFSPSEVLSGWYELPGQGRDDYRAVAHVIARKDLALGILDKLIARGLRVASVLVRDAKGDPLPVDLRNSLAIAEHPSARRWRRLCAGSACAAVVLAITAGLMMLSRQAAELELLDRRLQAAEVEAKKVRVEIDAIEASSQRISGLRKEKLNSPSLLAVWAELTRLLPDSAWLNGLSVRESAITIDGTAQSAETLIATLDGSPLFGSVAFTGPVTKLPSGKLDRFTATFNLSQPAAATGLASR